MNPITSNNSCCESNTKILTLDGKKLLSDGFVETLFGGAFGCFKFLHMVQSHYVRTSLIVTSVLDVGFAYLINRKIQERSKMSSMVSI
jgi:hypothetical protein